MTINQPYEEKELLDAFTSRKPHAFKEIYSTYFSQLYLYAHKIIDDSEEAKDITIAVFTKLFAKSGDFNNLADIRGFLYTSTRNACFNHLKLQQRKNAAQQEILSGLSEAGGMMGEQLEGEMIAILYNALQQLPSSSRKILELLYIEGKKYAEAAQILDVSIETIKSQRSYGIKKLRQLLADHPELLLLISHIFIGLKK